MVIQNKNKCIIPINYNNKDKKILCDLTILIYSLKKHPYEFAKNKIQKKANIFLYN